MTTAKKDDDAITVSGGRRSPQKTEVFDWVPLSGVKPASIALYNLLRMHVNRSREDDRVWTSKLTLAVMMKLSRGDKIDPYLKQLIAIGAVEVIKGGMHNVNHYIVHALPPPGYRGPLDLKTWYATHKPLLTLKRDEEKKTRDARRTMQRAAKEQVKPVTPKTGEQAVTPKTGEQVTPKTGNVVPPKTGREPSRGFEPTEDEPPTPPSSSLPPPPWADSPKQEQEGSPESAKSKNPPVVLSIEEESLFGEVMKARRDWSPSVLRLVLGDDLIRERPDRELVRVAFLIAAKTRKTVTPRRLLHDTCPHWAQAWRELYGDGEAPDGPPQQRSGPPRPWCGDMSCDPVTRQLLNDDHRPRFGPDGPLFCECSGKTAPAQSTAGARR